MRSRRSHDLDRRIVVLGARADEVRAGADLRGAEIVVCDDWAEGMGASLRRGLAAAGDADEVVIMLADQPFLTAAVVARVRAAAGPAARAVFGGAPGHPVVLRRALLARAGELHGDRGLPRAAGGGDGGRVRGPRRPARHRHASGPGGGATVKLEQSFEVDAPVEQVWTALIDLEKVAPCLPGAAITGHDDDGTYHGEFQVKLGPTTASYRGTIKIESADAETHTATLAARGSDKRGQGGASATIVNTLHATDAGGTRVDAVTDFTITGRLASFGRGGMIKDISNRLLRDFAACLQQRLATEPAGALTGDEAAASAGAAAAADPEAAPDAPAQAAPSTPPPAAETPPPAPAPAAKPINGISLFFSVLAERIKRLFKRSS